MKRLSRGLLAAVVIIVLALAVSSAAYFILRTGGAQANAPANQAPQAASVHEKDAELFYMIDGTATLVTGGKLVEGTKDGDNWRGKAIEGGKAQKMSKGDFMLVPAGVPHWFTDISGQITEFSLHLPAK